MRKPRLQQRVSPSLGTRGRAFVPPDARLSSKLKRHFSDNGFHHPWRSTAWKIHPVMKVEVIQ
jgi:hypothetical protein